MTDLSEEFVRRGHLVTVATSRSRTLQTWSSDLAPIERVNGVDVYRFPALQRGRAGWHSLKFGNDGYRRTRSRRYEPFILIGNGPLAMGIGAHILRHGRGHDLVHLQTLPYAHVVYGYFCARMVGRPVVLTPHIHVDQPEVFDLPIFNHVLRRADMVIAVSQREISYLTERGVNAERILVAGNGIRLSELPRLDPLECRSRLGLPRDAFVVLLLGRKESYKGLATALAAIGQLQHQEPAPYLISAGPPTECSRRLARDYAQLPRWIDLDTVTHAQKVDLLNACDVLLLPSTGEAFGIVFLEAWAVGKPVIGARAGAIPWVIDEGVDGLLTDPSDPQALAEAIEQLATCPELAQRLSSNGHAKVRARYTVERVADQIENGYRQVIRGSRSRPAA